MLNEWGAHIFYRGQRVAEVFGRFTRERRHLCLRVGAPALTHEELLKSCKTLRACRFGMPGLLQHATERHGWRV